MLQDGSRGAGARVVADQQRGVEPAVDAVHHAQRRRRPGGQRNAGRHPLEAQIGAVLVAVGDDDLGGAGGQTALYGRFRIALHVAAGHLILRRTHVGLSFCVDPAYAFEVDAHEHLHGTLQPGWIASPRRQARAATRLAAASISAPRTTSKGECM